MKTEHKIWLEPETYRKLEDKARAEGFTGKGFVSHYIEKLCNYNLIYVDHNLQGFVDILSKIKKK
jgi:hypothetical protein